MWESLSARSKNIICNCVKAHTRTSWASWKKRHLCCHSMQNVLCRKPRLKHIRKAFESSALCYERKCHLFWKAALQTLHNNRQAGTTKHQNTLEIITLCDQIQANKTACQQLDMVDSPAAVSPVHDVQLQVSFRSDHQWTMPYRCLSDSVVVQELHSVVKAEKAKD